ncbi:MAG: hypothetical protein E6923_04030 [Clostridium sp.]|uniref:hypothetical protein n=1 Tax=Clostridium sp. TaxID=1506 RepID=UPI00290013F5|nr:hypothetical protein [Clostridium sp.]MDU1309878.1 hypothetical protein [Clostridium sp.]MDU1407032.1 hypothetical protein [Clostridium sp.]
MYTTSTAYKTEIQKRVRSFECRVTIGDRVFTNNEVQSIDLNGGIQDIFSIGNTPSVCLELVLRNTTDTIFTTNSVKVEIGLKIGNTIEYVPLGIFNIEDVKKDDYTTKFTCYDNMTKFEIAYFSSLGDKPTLQQVVNELASKTGIQFTGSLPSYTVKKLEGFTCGEVLGYVASLCGGNALITRDGKFTIVYPTDISKDIGEGVFDLQRDEVKYKIGKITCQVKEQETISKGSLGTDSMELSFENPWVTETILTDIYNRLNGFNYLGYTMKWQGDLSLDIGDIITYTDAKKVTRKLPILYRKLSYDGGLDSELSAKGETKNKNSFNSSGSMSNKLNRVVTEVAIVNKAFIDYANINDANIKNLQAETAKIHNLEVETANINNILAGNIGSGSIQTIHLTGKNVVIDNAVIKSAMIDSLDLSKLNAGTISTNKFRITSDNGGIEIVGATQQFKDKNNKVRIQMGQDTQGNFNFILRGADGTTTLIDHTGIKEKAIADDLIKSNMVAADAIGEKQINYSSLITGLNKDDNTSLIKASKVAIDLTGQSLEVAFSSLKSNIDNMEIGGVNLFVKKTATKNKYLNNSGVEVDEPNWFYTDYINVEGMKNIIASGYVNLGSAPSTCYYDSNKRFVKGINNKGQSLSKLITIDSGISYIRFSCDIRGFETLKLEQGTKSTVYSHSPEDIDQVTQSLQTQINANIKGIETLVKDTTIKQGDSTVKLQDFYSSFIQTKGEISQKVTQAEIDSSINKIKIGSTNLLRNTGIEKDTSYFSLANGVTRDTSVKCLGTNTFKYDISGSTADVWRSANPTPVDVVEGEQYSASGYINIASAAINNTATFQLEIQWYDASGKRILTNAAAVDRSIRDKWQLIKCEGKVAPVGAVKANCRIWVQRNGMCWVGRLQLEKGTKCSDWSSSPMDTEQRVNSVEQKITATAITTTITEAINAGTNSFTTMQFVLDKNGATIKNGALRILNNAGTEVLKGDVAGNLIINGLFKQYTSSGIPSIAIQNNMIEIYDWDPPSHKPENKIGGICSVNGTYGSYGRRASVAVYGDINHALILGWDSLNDGIHPVLTIDKPEVVSKLQPVTLWENMSIVDTAKFDFLGKDNNGATTRQGQIWISSSQDFIITSNFLNRSGTVKLASYKDGSSSAYTNLSANPTGVRIHGALTIDGAKARTVDTIYGSTTLNAVESADALFEDCGEGFIGEDGLCYIYIDPILLDTINTKCNYQVFVQAYGEGNVYPVERTETYFIVKGTPGLKFGWRLTAKQRGYENYRLEMIDYENPEQDYLDSLREEEIFKEDINYEELGYAYLENYEKELLANG